MKACLTDVGVITGEASLVVSSAVKAYLTDVGVITGEASLVVS